MHQGGGLRYADKVDRSALTRRFDHYQSSRAVVGVTTPRVKRAFTYRFHPTDAQVADLSHTFGCVRKVYNLALAARTEAWARQERLGYGQPSALLTAWKKTEEQALLNEVSSVPLQQTLRHLQSAFTHSFGKRAEYPRFKSRKTSQRSAEYTTIASASATAG